MNKHIIKIKQLFLVGVASLAVIIVGGSYLFKGTGALSMNNLERNVSYFKYKVAFGTTTNSLLAGVGAVFGNNNASVVQTNENGDAGLVPVLVYHGIVSNPDRFSMTQATFAEQMEALKKEGYETISMKELYGFVHDHKTVPEKSFVLTFDDGRKDSFYGADPVLKALGYKAVMFIATGVSLPDASQKPSTYYLDADEIKKMALSTGRWEIQSHAIQANGGFVSIDAGGTKGNFLSNKMWVSEEGRLETNTEYEARVALELQKSKQSIIDKVGITPIAFSYPFGDYGQQTNNLESYYSEKVIQTAIEKTYSLAFQQIWPVDHEFSQNYPGSDSYHLKRIEPSPLWSGAELIEHLDSGKLKPLPFTNVVTTGSEWKNLWGGLSVDNLALRTNATVQTNGSFTFLDGTYPWKDYVYTANIDWHAGTSVALIARYKDANNYVTCIFSNNNARVEQRTFSTNEKFNEEKIPFTFPKEKLPLSILVKDNTAKCFIGNTMVAHSEGLSPVVGHGGIGIKTWDEKVNVSDITIRGLVVSEVTDATIAEDILPTIETIALETPKPTTSIPKPTPSPVTPPKETVKPVVPIVLSGLVPYNVTNFVDISAWKNLWGSLSGGATGLSIGASATSSGGFSVLQGGNDWHNYELMVRPSKVAGLSFSLVARYDNTGKYVSCTFTNDGRGSVRLDLVDGTKITQIGNTIPLSRFTTNNWSNTPFAIHIYEDMVTCSINGQDGIHSSVPGIPQTGGIGVKTWSKNVNGSEVIIKEVQVTKLF